jgi:acyl-coenzyme A synthetase/AMP-(fatty) acid ligase
LEANARIIAGYIKHGKIDKREKTFDGKTWYCTGDRGTRDKDGYFWFVGEYPHLKQGEQH